MPLAQCTSSLEPELWALASAIAAVPRNAELTVWCDNQTAVQWLKQVERMRVENCIEDYRHDKDKTATVLRALIKSLMAAREAPLTVHHVRAHQPAATATLEERLNNRVDELARGAQVLPAPPIYLPPLDDPAMWIVIGDGEVTDVPIGKWVHKVAASRNREAWSALTSSDESTSRCGGERSVRSDMLASDLVSL